MWILSLVIFYIDAYKGDLAARRLRIKEQALSVEAFAREDCSTSSPATSFAGEALHSMHSADAANVLHAAETVQNKRNMDTSWAALHLQAGPVHASILFKLPSTTPRMTAMMALGLRRNQMEAKH